MATIKIVSDVSVTMSMHGSQAVLFHNPLEGLRVDPRVVLATLIINPTIVRVFQYLYFKRLKYAAYFVTRSLFFCSNSY